MASSKNTAPSKPAGSAGAAPWQLLATPTYEKQAATLQKGRSKSLKKIGELIESVRVSPRSGIGHPEPLKGNFSGCWSRRIDRKNRLVYEIDEDARAIHLLSCRGHYQDR